jgi:hypothetical protein
MAESVYINHQQQPIRGGGGGVAFTCSCGAVLTDQEAVHNHSFECIQMQQDGLASFAQGLHSLVAPLSLQTAAAQERKLANLKAIFSLYVPSVEPVGGPAMQQRPPRK